jgi:hypothetical protein
MLVGFGFWHARRVPETAEILPRAKATTMPVTA